MMIKFFPNDKQNPPGKLADAELHFDASPLDGLKLLGFAIWERKNGGRNVTFPARQYSVNGERRSFALLRPRADATAQDMLRDVILSAYAEHEAAITDNGGGSVEADGFQWAPSTSPAQEVSSAATKRANTARMS